MERRRLKPERRRWMFIDSRRTAAAKPGVELRPTGAAGTKTACIFHEQIRGGTVVEWELRHGISS